MATHLTVGLAQIDCRRGDWGAALSHLDRALAVDPRSVRALHVVPIRRHNTGPVPSQALDQYTRG